MFSLESMKAKGLSRFSSCLPTLPTPGTVSHSAAGPLLHLQGVLGNVPLLLVEKVRVLLSGEMALRGACL